MTAEIIEPQVLLIGWDPPVQKIPLVRLLREHAGLSLSEATQAIDRCLKGETVRVAMTDVAAAEALADLIAPLGLHAEVQRSAPV